MTGALAGEAFLGAATAFGPLAFGCVEPWALAVLQGLILAAVFFSATSGLPRADSLACRLLLAGALPFLALTALQWLHPVAPDAPRTLWPSTLSSYRTGRALELLALYAGLFWGATRLFAAPKARERFLWLVFLLGAAVAAIGLFQLASGSTAVYGFRPARYGRSPFGPYFNRAHAASFMSLSALIGAGLFAGLAARFSKDRAAGTPASELLARLAFLLAGLAVIAAGLVKADNRGAVLSLIAAGAGAALLAARKPRALLAGAVCLAAIALLGARAFTFKENAVSHRVSMYRSGARMLADRPLFGAGQGALIAGFPAYQEPVIEDIVDHVHSDWLELAIESGLSGLAIVCACLALLGAKLIRAWAASPASENRWLLGGVLAAAMAFALHQLVEFSFHIPANAAAFITLLAWLSAAAAPQPAKPAALPRLPAALAVLLLAAVFARPAVAWHWARRASEAPGESRAFYLAKAASWDPSADHFYSLARHYWMLADEHPEAQEDLLRSALAAARAALDSEPLHGQARALTAAALWRLERPADAHELRQGGAL